MRSINWVKLRQQMAKQQIAGRGIRDRLVLHAMRTVPRERFVPSSARDRAYDDSPLPIAGGQTISQPYIVAFMIAALRLQGVENVLEIGTGSGYAAAVLAEISGQVYTVERIEELAQSALQTLQSLNYRNVQVVCGDGTMGLPALAPYDAIIVAAGAPAVPESLKAQLKIGGRLVIPVGDKTSDQKLIRIVRTSPEAYQSEIIASVRFVPLIGQEGWSLQINSI